MLMSPFGFMSIYLYYTVRWKGLEGERAKRGAQRRSERRQKRHGMAFLARAQMKRICSLNGNKRGIRSRFAETYFRRTTIAPDTFVYRELSLFA